MVRPLVVGVDGSDASFLALDWAVDARSCVPASPALSPRATITGQRAWPATASPTDPSNSPASTSPAGRFKLSPSAASS